jgi:apolipoprotein N-acyltransferase
LNSKPFWIIAFAGLVLNVPFFYPMLGLPGIGMEFLPFVLIAPVWVALREIPVNRRYWAGLLFFGLWLIPTSYWYFNFMTWWQAVLSLTYFTLIANVFALPGLLRVRHPAVDFMLMAVAWLGLTYGRMHLPVLQEWWIPHLAYTQWQNLLILQVAKFGGIYAIIGMILLVNAVLALLWTYRKKVQAVSVVLLLTAAMLIGNALIRERSDRHHLSANFIAVQASPAQGFHADADAKDIQNLQRLTEEALAQPKRSDQNTFVLWPENMIKPEQTSALKSFARRNGIYLIFDRAEAAEDDPYNTVVMLNPEGQEILKNYKTHTAPGEKIQTRNVHRAVTIDGIKITSDICYDLHYSDLSKRAAGNDLMFAPVDDDRFGRFMPLLHAQDVIVRAIENRIDIFTASTNGPTMYVDRYGVIRSGPMTIYDEGYLIQ